MERTVKLSSVGDSDKRTLLAEAAALTKRNLLSVGGHVDTPVDLLAVGNADGKLPCLGNGQNVLMRTPTQAEFVECHSDFLQFLLTILFERGEPEL